MTCKYFLDEIEKYCQIKKKNQNKFIKNQMDKMENPLKPAKISEQLACNWFLVTVASQFYNALLGTSFSPCGGNANIRLRCHVAVNHNSMQVFSTSTAQSNPLIVIYHNSYIYSTAQSTSLVYIYILSDQQTKGAST